jgi:hypothetical protein
MTNDDASGLSSPLPSLDEVWLPAKPAKSLAGTPTCSFRDMPSMDSLTFSVKNTFLHFGDESNESVFSGSALRSRTWSPQPRSRAWSPQPRAALHEECDDVSLPDTDDEFTPAATERWSPLGSYQEERLEGARKPPGTRTVLELYPRLAQQIDEATRSPQSELHSKSKAAREKLWNSMNAGLAETKPEAKADAKVPQSKAQAQDQLRKFVADMMVQQGFHSPRGHLLMDVYVEVWRDVVGPAVATGGKTALERFAAFLSEAPQLFEVYDMNIVPLYQRTRSAVAVDNMQKMIRLKSQRW